MPFEEIAGLRFYQFGIFPAGITQGVFSRRGGVSPAPWNSLNVGGTVGDDQRRVQENRRRSFEILGRSPDSMFDVWQVHSADMAVAMAPRSVDTPHKKADIILTNNPAVSLYMRFADCVPILLHDPVRRVVCIAHAGWLGTVRGAARRAVEAMTESFGSSPADVLGAIGPSIGPDHYEVGPDVLAQVESAFGTDAFGLVDEREGHTYLDLWEANRLQLTQAGVRSIELARLCTACHTEDWFSHRAEKGQTGRFGALMALTT